MAIDEGPEGIFFPLLGKNCCRQRVGRGRSLSIGFGERVPQMTRKTIDGFYGEWEVGTYSSAWRIVLDGKIVLGSLDVTDSVDELDQRLQNIKLGSVTAIKVLSQFDIRLEFDGDAHIDFIYASTEDDEIFHIFGPENIYLEYTSSRGWKVGRSNVSWS